MLSAVHCVHLLLLAQPVSEVESLPGDVTMLWSWVLHIFVNSSLVSSLKDPCAFGLFLSPKLFAQYPLQVSLQKNVNIYKIKYFRYGNIFLGIVNKSSYSFIAE